MSHVPIAHEHDRAAKVVERLGEEPFDAVEFVYVVDSSGMLKGAVRLVELLRAPRDAEVGPLVDLDYPRVGTHDDHEQVAAAALARRATSVAVVHAGRLVGVVPALSLLEILRHEHVEDLHRLAGIQHETARTRSALEDPPLRRARHRLPWLLVGLAGSMLAAGLVSRFEHVLQDKLALAFFVPAIVYLADAVGTQTEAIAVRGLSLSRIPIRHLLASELRTGLLIGFALAALAFPVVSLMFGDMTLGASVAVAILVAGAVATTIGLLLPWLLQRSGSDPAFGSGPLATIIQDVLSLLIYFVVASLIMR